MCLGMSGLNHSQCGRVGQFAGRAGRDRGEADGLQVWAALLKKHMGMWVRMGHNKTEVSARP